MSLVRVRARVKCEQTRPKMATLEPNVTPQAGFALKLTNSVVDLFKFSFFQGNETIRLKVDDYSTNSPLLLSYQSTFRGHFQT